MKKLCSLLLTLAMVFSFAGCGSSDPSDVADKAEQLYHQQCGYTGQGIDGGAGRYL